MTFENMEINCHYLFTKKKKRTILTMEWSLRERKKRVTGGKTP